MLKRAQRGGFLMQTPFLCLGGEAWWVFEFEVLLMGNTYCNVRGVQESDAHFARRLIHTLQ